MLFEIDFEIGCQLIRQKTKVSQICSEYVYHALNNQLYDIERVKYKNLKVLEFDSKKDLFEYYCEINYDELDGFDYNSILEDFENKGFIVILNEYVNCVIERF